MLVGEGRESFRDEQLGPRLGFGRAVLQDLHFLYRDQSTRHHAVEHWQEGIDFLLCIDDLDYDRQILRKAKDFGGVYAARMPEPDLPSQDGRTADAHFPCF